MYAPGAIFRVVIHGLQSASIETSLAFQFILTASSGDLTFAEVVADLVDVAEGFAASMQTFQGEDQVWTAASVSELDGSVVSGQVAFTAPIVGDNTADNLLPSQTAVGVNFPTGISRRALRKFIPGLTIAAVDGNGNFTPTAIGLVQTAVDAWLLEQEETNGSWRYMYQSDDELLEPPQVYPMSAQVSPVPKVQRRRRP